ncbi:MAG: transcription termination/antitermination factor NusG [Deltaproteobacteria bacterium]|nr:transcription termination/antitermination factor NusG [Deltaproteobacteria bacterium]
MALRWYVVHTYSGFENTAKKALEERVQSLGFQDRIVEILVPTEQVVEMRAGTKRVVPRKFLPGYLLVRMELDDETWHVVKETPKVTGFVGNMRNPPPVPDEEVTRMTDRMDEGRSEPKPVVHFERGEEVRVIDGPFATMRGSVEESNPTRRKLRVMVSIFGRSTAVELDFAQVEKVS